jgi:hypothetical protein
MEIKSLIIKPSFVFSFCYRIYCPVAWLENARGIRRQKKWLDVQVLRKSILWDDALSNMSKTFFFLPGKHPDSLFHVEN